MGQKTAYLQKRIVDHVLGKVTYARPTTVYLALFTAATDAAGAQTSEVSGGSYARQAITSVMQLADAVSGTSINTAVVTFPNPTAAWGTILGFGLMDAATGGNMLYYGLPDTPRTIASGGPPFTVPAGTLVVVES